MPLTKIDTIGIQDDAITADQIADGTVIAADILDNTITGGKLATDIVISTSGNITTTGNFTSLGIDDNATANVIVISDSAITPSSDSAIDLGTNLVRYANVYADTLYGDGSSLTALNISTDSTPQLGGNLDLNSNDITGTGNINITGTATVSGDLTVDTNTLYVDSANNRVGIGTSSPDSLLSLALSGSTGTYFEGGGTADSSNLRRLLISSSTTTSAGDTHTLNAESSSGNLAFATSNSEAMRIDNSGNVGIGTSSPSEKLQVEGNIRLLSGSDIKSSSSGGNISLFGGLNYPGGKIQLVGGLAASNAGTILFSSGTGTTVSERMRIDSSGNVGIGTSSPNSKLNVVDSSGGNGLLITGTSDRNVAKLETVSGAVSRGQLLLIEGASDTTLVKFTSEDSVDNFINNGGNVLVGTTDFGVGGTTNTGIALNPNGPSAISRSSNPPITLNRTTDDGTIALFRKDGSTVGSIGAEGNALYLGTGDTGIRFAAGSDAFHPFNPSTLADRDNAIDIGLPGIRFDDIYATNGTIQTSDQNEKQSIQSLTVSEIAVAKRISKLFKTFKWNSAVEEKGDNARIHTGIIAQDVQQAFADEGLDAGNYALFISGTWWEKEISVDAVAEELDEEGNVLVEGKDAYTYIDTKEEATEGYTERTRLGIRYPELLSFVSSAFEQRLTNIETRLTALET